MPQPLSNVTKHTSILIGNTGMQSPFQQRPALALLVAEVINTWCTVESFMMRLFVDLMGGHKELAAKVFLAMEIQSAKAVAITTAADSKLPDHHKALLRAILALVKTHQKSRDKIVHWTWGYSPDIPDALLLIDPKDLVGPFKMDRIYVYRERDFVDCIRANVRLAEYVECFRIMLSGTPGQYEQLSSEPEIRERLDRQASKDRSPHEG